MHLPLFAVLQIGYSIFYHGHVDIRIVLVTLAIFRKPLICNCFYP